MSAIKESIAYFEKGGPDNTLETLRLAVAEAKKLGIKKLVAASSTGFTAEALMGMKEAEGLDITIVTLAYTDQEPYNRLSEEKRRAFIEKGFHVCTAGHALSSSERSISGTFHGAYPAEIMAHALRMIGRGTKVCLEIGAMACDAGYIRAGESVMAVAGSGGGADTAVVLRPYPSATILKTKVDRFVCKPID